MEKKKYEAVSGEEGRGGEGDIIVEEKMDNKEEGEN